MKRTILDGISLRSKGIDRYIIYTGITLPDDDEVHIVLEKKPDGRWVLTDEGHTMMWLSYEVDVGTKTRTKALNPALISNHAQMDNGSIEIDCTGRDPGQCLLSMVTVLLQVADILYLSPHNVRSTYTDDIKRMMNEELGGRCVFDKKIVFGTTLSHKF